MRTAISTSCSSRSAGVLLSTSSVTICGCFWRKRASIAGRTSTPTNSDTLIRTVPATRPGGADASRTNIAEARAMVRAAASSPRASLVGIRPVIARVNKVVPSAASSEAMRARTVGWATPSWRAAAERLPVSRTARKVR